MNNPSLANAQYGYQIITMTNPKKSEEAMPEPASVQPKVPELPPEIGGQKGPEPTRFGDWEKNGRCTDF